MRFITGDECGLLKEITTLRTSSRHGGGGGGSNTSSDALLPPPQHQQRRINVHDEMTRQHGIIKMIQWDNPHSTANTSSSTATTTSTIAALRKNGSVQIWERQPQLLSSSTKKKHRNVNDYNSIRTIPNVFHSHGTSTNSERPLGMGPIHPTNHNDNDASRVFACGSTNGTIALVKLPTNADHLKADAVVETISTTLSSSKSSTTSMSKSTPNDFLNTIPSRISTFAAHPTLPQVIMGGKDRDMVLYDLQHCGSGSSTGSAAPVVLWKAKNLPPHPQTLLQPQIWPTACCFWNPNVLVVGTAYRQIRLYDLRLSCSSQVGTTITSSSSSSSPLDTKPQQPQRRPILYSSQPMTEYRITALCPLSRSNHNNSIIVGDAGGTMVSIDLRQLNNITTTNHNNSTNNTTTTSRNHTNHLLSPSAVTGRYIGPTGCITDIVEWHSPPHHKSSSSLQHCIASVGYDRMLRIYNTKTKQQLHQIYCKQRLNCVLPLLSSDDGYNEDDDEDEHYSNGPNDHRQVSDQVEENDDDDIVKDYRNSSSDDDDDDDDDLSEENEEDIVDEMTAIQSSLRDDDNDEEDEEGEDEDDDDEDEGEDEDHDEDDELENDDFVDADEADEEEEEEEPIRKRNRRR